MGNRNRKETRRRIRDIPAARAQDAALRNNTKLIRHAAIRRLLIGRYHTNGVASLDQLQQELEATAGIRANINTLSADMRELGGIKVRDAERPKIEWYVLPAWNPNVEDLRLVMDAQLIEHEVSQKIAMHVLDIAPVNNFVYVMTESRAGALVGYWISWLSWQGIVFVQEQLDGCIIHCLSDDYAMRVAARLVGDTRLQREEEEGDSSEEEAED